jgi:hypothetical protein
VVDSTACRDHLATLRKLFDEDPADLTSLRETIVAKTLEAGKYPLGWAQS